MTGVAHRLALLATPIMLAVAAGASLAGSPAAIKLRSDCPPSFEKHPDGHCRFVSLYQLYEADPGQGGLRVPLPRLHDGFTPEQADLGRYLFFDPVLSGDHTVACAHCHHPDLGFADGRPTSQGRGATGVGPDRHGGVPLSRAAPTLWNVGFQTRFFWDGRAKSLEEQAEGPLFSADEMAATPEALLRSLAESAEYRRLFGIAFSRSASRPITLAEVTTALAAFEATLVSVNSRYDRYAHGDAAALSDVEVRGFNVFRGFVARCSQCHVPPLFAGDDVAVVGAPPVPGQAYDLGAAQVRDDPTLRGAFKVPTLRNVALTAPYFQAGQLATLEDVLAFYNDRRGHATASLGLQLHWHIHMDHPELTPADIEAVVAFLKTLTDESLRPAIPPFVPSGLPVLSSPTHLAARAP